jgi:nucleoside 2-deoxyribosyltransferase
MPETYCKGMKTITAYLAHPRLNKAEGAELQKKIEVLGIRVINPFQRPQEQVYDQIVSKSGRFSAEQIESIVEGDLRKIEEADIIVAMVTGKASAGTHMEVFYASRILHRQVFVLYNFIREGENVHPWYDYLTWVCVSEHELLEALRTYIR